MTSEDSFFGLRFGSNANLCPSPEELKAFLESPKRGKGEVYGDGLIAYRQLLERLAAFELRQRENIPVQDFREEMFCEAISCSGFFNPALIREVELFDYYMHALIMLDFRKPAAFIHAAEEEIVRLNPKKKDEAAKIERLRGMADERKKALAAIESDAAEFMRELADIARYIRENLIRIEKKCEKAIVLLVDLQVAGREKSHLIEEIKSEFKEHLRDALHSGLVSRDYLESVKKDVGILTREIADLLREDVYALTGVFETIHEHVQRIARELDSQLSRVRNRKQGSQEEARVLFLRIEHALHALVTEHNGELHATEIRTETVHDAIIREKRRELLEHIFTLLQKDRRARHERRSGIDRRTADATSKGPQRRGGTDRRKNANRRK